MRLLYMWSIKVADDVVILVGFEITGINPWEKIPSRKSKTKKIHIAITHNHTLLVFLSLNCVHNILYVRGEYIHVSMRLRIWPINDPNYNISFRFVNNKDANVFSYYIIQCFFYKKTYTTSRTVFATARNEIMVTWETKSWVMRTSINFTDPNEIKGEWISMQATYQITNDSQFAESPRQFKWKSDNGSVTLQVCVWNSFGSKLLQEPFPNWKGESLSVVSSTASLNS